ncbi:MAG: GNAT family N-acetyltransferase [FCB group bacterium]|nr:GNAT family N-acetyltransferase [FCB group bacterium]
MANEKKIALREITEDTVRKITALEVAENQKGFVALNSISLSQALFSHNAWYRAIYADDTPVGFVMLHIDTDKAEYFLWRYMIDHRYQGKGYGYKAMELVIDYVRGLPEAGQLLTSYIPGTGDPSGFYLKLGFVETGEMEEEERVLALELQQ